MEGYYRACAPKKLPEGRFDRDGYVAFWNEWHRRRGNPVKDVGVYLSAAHEYCSNNKKTLKKDGKCGCIYCLEIFDPKEIKRWLNEGDGTAVCPYCGTDSVIGESSGFPIEPDFLRKMNEYWFG